MLHQNGHGNRDGKGYKLNDSFARSRKQVLRKEKTLRKRRDNELGYSINCCLGALLEVMTKEFNRSNTNLPPALYMPTRQWLEWREQRHVEALRRNKIRHC